MSMAYIATFDIGTTAVKGILMKDDDQVCAEQSYLLHTAYGDGTVEQDPDQWYEAFCAICQLFVAALPPKQTITAVVMSGQMQDTILLDADCYAVGSAILYSDGRAGQQAEALHQLLGKEAMAAVTGNVLDNSLPFAKLLWIKEHEPQRYQCARKVVFSSKDYIIARLTGVAVTDYTTAATTGCMNIAQRSWCVDWLQQSQLRADLLPELYPAEQLAGTVTAQGAQQSGLLEGTAVYTGSGDAGATTLASGITQPGEININLGTSGWVAAISQQVENRPSVFNLVATSHAYYINVVPFLNAGNVHHWVTQTYADGDYLRLQELTRQSSPGAGGVFCLPYLVGERYPVMDAAVRGSFLGITPETTTADLVRSALEGVTFSIRQGLGSLHHQPQQVSLIGGGAQDPVWCQMMADVLGLPVTVYAKSEVLPAMTMAAIAQLAQGMLSDYQQLTARLRQQVGCTVYQPDQTAVALYDKLFDRYQQLYPAVKAFYQIK